MATEPVVGFDFDEVQAPAGSAGFDFDEVSSPAPGQAPPVVSPDFPDYRSMRAPDQAMPPRENYAIGSGGQTLPERGPQPEPTPSPFDERQPTEADVNSAQWRSMQEGAKWREGLTKLAAFAARDVASIPYEQQAERTAYWQEVMQDRLRQATEAVTVAGAYDWQIAQHRLAGKIKQLRAEGYDGTDLKERVLQGLPFVRWYRNKEQTDTAGKAALGTNWIQAEPWGADEQAYSDVAKAILQQDWNAKHYVASKALSLGTGLADFVIELGVLRGMIPEAVPAWIAEPTAWAAQATGESGTIKAAPLGALLGGTFKGLKSLEQAGKISGMGALAGESATLMGISAASGADPDDIVISGLIPPLFRGMANVRRYFRQPFDRANSFDELIGAAETVKRQGAELAARHGELQQFIDKASPEALENLRKVWGPKVKDSATASAVIDLIDAKAAKEPGSATPAESVPKEFTSTPEKAPPVTKAELLTPEGALEWAKSNPEASTAIVRQMQRTESLPARGAFESVAPRKGAEKWSAAERNQFGELVKSASNAQAEAEPEGLLGAKTFDEFTNQLKSIDQTAKDRIISSHDPESRSWFDKLKERVVGIKNRATRAQEFVPNIPEFASFNEYARLLKVVPSAMADEAARRVYSAVEGLTRGELFLFESYLRTADQVAADQRGNRVGFSMPPEAAVKLKAELDPWIAKSPNVQAALQRRKALVEGTASEMVALNLLPPEALEDAKDYFHREVLAYQEDARRGGGGRPQPVRRSFQRERISAEKLPDGGLGPEYDWRSSYVEAETAWLSDALQEIQKAKLWQKMVTQYDIIDQLRTEAAQSGDGKTWRDILRDRPDHAIYQSLPGKPGYPAASMTAKITEAIQAQVLAGTDLKPEEIDLLPIAGVKLYVLPKELVAQLEQMQSQEPRKTWLLDELMKDWKAYVLLNPKRAFQYMIRNLTGDAEGGLWNNALSTASVPRAAAEMWSYYFKPRSPISEEIKTARDLGVFSSGRTATVLPEMRDMRLFRGLYDDHLQLKPTAPAKAIQWWFDHAKDINEWRESVFRFATFKALRKKLSDGDLSWTYASKADVIRQLVEEHGVDVAAAKLSRELYGDYQNMTVLGEFIAAKLFPFWRWQEVDAKRYARLTANAFESGDYKSGAAAAGIGAAKMGSSAAWRILKPLILLKLAAPWAAVSLYNLLAFPELEKKLSREERSNMHIILGQNEDGTIRLWRNMGALNDFLEWFGLNTLVSRLPLLESGQMSVGELLDEMWQDPLNKLVGQVRPDAKAVVELTAGLSFFPNAMNPRTAERDITALRIFGLDDEYRKLRGWITQNGETPRTHYWQRYFVGVSDPRRNALYELYNLRHRFLKRIGKPEESGIYPISQFRNIREAVGNEDYESYKKALQAYFDSGKDWKTYDSSVRFVDPIASRLNARDERKFEREFLNEQQRATLDIARTYAKDLQVRLRQWKRRAIQDGIRPTKKK